MQGIKERTITGQATGIRRPLEMAATFADRLAFLAPLLTRIVIGQAFFLTGRGKWANLDNVVGFFSELGIPMPYANAVFIALLELVGGLCLIAGLGTRLFSLLLSATMIVALLTADRENFLKALGSDLTSVAPVVMLLSLIWLVFFGAGPVSLDHLIFRGFRRDATDAAKG